MFKLNKFLLLTVDDMEILCPCNSRKKYRDCCKILHDGGFPESALALMRSRYSAYALDRPGYTR